MWIGGGGRQWTENQNLFVGEIGLKTVPLWINRALSFLSLSSHCSLSMFDDANLLSCLSPRSLKFQGERNMELTIGDIPRNFNISNNYRFYLGFKIVFIDMATRDLKLTVREMMSAWSLIMISNVHAKGKDKVSVGAQTVMMLMVQETRRVRS